MGKIPGDDIIENNQSSLPFISYFIHHGSDSNNLRIIYDNLLNSDCNLP
jgi:hypothetical protein